MRHAVAVVALVLSPLLANASETLSVHNWNDYIDPIVLADFQRETGITVEYNTYSTREEIEQRLNSDTRIDVAMPPHDLLASLIQGKRLRPLNPAQLDNRQHLDRELLAKLAPLDPGNRHALPYLWTSAGLAINVPQAESAYGGPLPPSWSVLFDPSSSQRLATCGISLLDAPYELYSGLLNYQGQRFSRTTQRRLARATDTLLTLRPNVRYIDSERYIDDLNAGHLCVALAWSGDALAAAAAGQPVQFVIPEEGTALSIDSMVIPVTAANPDAAHRFINYLMRPEVAARISNATFYASANKAAGEHLAPELRRNPAMFPDAQTKRRLALLESLPAKLEPTLTQHWNQVRQ